MTITEQLYYCDFQNCKFYYNNSPDDLGCIVEDNGDLDFQIDEENINLPLCKCFTNK